MKQRLRRFYFSLVQGNHMPFLERVRVSGMQVAARENVDQAWSPVSRQLNTWGVQTHVHFLGIAGVVNQGF